MQRCVDAVEVQIARATLRELDITHRFQRHAYEQMQLIARRLDERLNGDVNRDVMRRRAMAREK